MATQAQYRDLMLGTLPDSYATGSDSEVYKVASFLAAKWERLSDDIDALRRETWPGSAVDTIVEWEAFLGLPTPSAVTLAERQSICEILYYRKVTPSPTQIVRLLAMYLGFDVRVIETKRAIIDDLPSLYFRRIYRIGIEFGEDRYPAIIDASRRPAATNEDIVDTPRLVIVKTIIERIKQAHTSYFYCERHGFIAGESRVGFDSVSHSGWSA